MAELSHLAARKPLLLISITPKKDIMKSTIAIKKNAEIRTAAKYALIYLTSFMSA